MDHQRAVGSPTPLQKSALGSNAWLLATALSLLLLIGIGIALFRREPPPLAQARSEGDDSPAQGRAPEAPRALGPLQPAPRAEAARTPPDPLPDPAPASAGSAVLPPDPDSHAELEPIGVPGAHPHPITAEHERIQRELQLFEVMSDAVDAKDVAKIRSTVAEHRREYPGEHPDFDQGYEILADCLEHPGAASTAQAQRFFASETYSMMRRRIRRVCLEPQN